MEVQKLADRQEQGQRQRMNLSMRRSLGILAMGVSELTEFICAVYDRNPFLEADFDAAGGNDREGCVDLFARTPAPDEPRADLRMQLYMAADSDKVLQAGQAILESLDPDGYFREELAGFSAVLGLDFAAAKKALEIIRSLEPAGVGANSLSDCLMLQLLRLPTRNEIAEEIVSGHLELLAAGDIEELASACGAAVSETSAAADLIRSLEPRPLNGALGAPARYIVPEIRIEAYGSELEVSLLRRRPEIALSAFASGALSAAAEADRERLHGSIAETRELLASVRQRDTTILRVAREIVGRQSSHFVSGRPLAALTQRDVAETLGVDVSTVSRAVRDEYYEFAGKVGILSGLFVSCVTSGESQQEIMAAIESSVKGENPKRPRTDAQLACWLQSSGYDLTRRTVTKYRNLLGILPAPERAKK